MSPTQWMPWSGRIARRVCMVVVLLLLVGTTITHIYWFVLTRRIQAVISALSKLHIDETSENEVLQTVPYLIRNENDSNVHSSGEVGNIDQGVERFYYATISSNEQRWMKFEAFAERFSTVESWKDRPPKSWIFTAADLMGYRYRNFYATVTLLNGKVSSIRYGIANELVFPKLAGDIVSVRSVHSRWGLYQRGFYVPSADDENPQFQAKGDDRHLAVSFTPDASQSLRSHAFQVKLSCIWSLVGCHQGSQIAPLLSQDKDATDAETLTRLRSNDPCPDRILAGRVRYLPDLDVFLLESMGLNDENQSGTGTDEVWKHYKLIEVIRGRQSKLLENSRTRDEIIYPPYPGEYNQALPKKGEPGAGAGEKVLVFSNFAFGSCQVVPATASALSAIRNAIPASRRDEDQRPMGLM